jgi:outer membrane beta-barrel protein
MTRAPSIARRLPSGAAEREPRSGELCGVAPARQSVRTAKYALALLALLVPALARADDHKKQVAAAETSNDDAPQVGTTAMCIDQEIADRLAIKRKRRGAVDRLFVKQGRHELTVAGGYYASDLLSGTYVVGGSYTYHMTDETAVEFAGWWTHANADLIRALESDRGVVLEDTYARMIFAESLLVWSPVYGKLRLGGSVIHFDIHADLGVGVIDSKSSRGAAGVLGFGIKLFAGQAVAFRIDARNRTFRQDLLEERFLVNDAAVTAGFSLFLPFTN